MIAIFLALFLWVPLLTLFIGPCEGLLLKVTPTIIQQRMVVREFLTTLSAMQETLVNLMHVYELMRDATFNFRHYYRSYIDLYPGGHTKFHTLLLGHINEKDAVMVEFFHIEQFQLTPSGRHRLAQLIDLFPEFLIDMKNWEPERFDVKEQTRILGYFLRNLPRWNSYIHPCSMEGISMEALLQGDNWHLVDQECLLEMRLEGFDHSARVFKHLRELAERGSFLAALRMVSLSPSLTFAKSPRLARAIGPKLLNFVQAERGNSAMSALTEILLALKERFSLDARTKLFFSLEIMRVAVSRGMLKNSTQEAQLITSLLNENLPGDVSSYSLNHTLHSRHMGHLRDNLNPEWQVAINQWSSWEGLRKELANPAGRVTAWRRNVRALAFWRSEREKTSLIVTSREVPEGTNFVEAVISWGRKQIAEIGAWGVRHRCNDLASALAFWQGRIYELAQRGRPLLPHLNGSVLRVLLLGERLTEEEIQQLAPAMCINGRDTAGLPELIKELRQLFARYNIDEYFFEADPTLEGASNPRTGWTP